MLDKTNDLVSMVSRLRDGENLILEKGVRYDVWQAESEHLHGYYASNTATKEENPTGERFVAIYLKDKKNITIDGNGATLMLHGIMTPLLLDACENVTLKNLTIDYCRPTMSEYFVKKNDGKTAIIKLNEECLYTIRDGKLYFQGELGADKQALWEIPYKGDRILSMYYDPKTGYVRFLKNSEGERFPSLPSIREIKELEKGRLHIVWERENAFAPEGTIIQTRDVTRFQLGALFQYCKNIRLENVAIRAMHGFGLLSQYCENVLFDGVDCTPKKGRTIASNADFFHFSGCKGIVRIENCKAAGAHDDFINVHGTHLRVIEKNDNEKSIVVRFVNTSTWGFKAFFEKDKIEFIKWDTLLPYAKRKVISVEALNDTDIKLYLNKVAPTVELNKDVVENSTWTPKVKIQSNYFGPSMGRGILCTTQKKIRIKNNVFYKNGGMVLSIEDDCNFWFESGYTKNVAFKNNKVIDCGYGTGGTPIQVIHVAPQVLNVQANPKVHKKVVVKGNRFVFKKGSWRDPYFAFVKRVIYKRNTFEEIEKI